MGGIESLVVLPVAALHLAVMPRGIGPDYLVADAMLFQTHLKKGGLVPVCGEAVCELSAVIRLDALNGEGEGFHKVFHKQGRGIGAVFLKSLHKTPSGILVNGGILEEMFSDYLTVYKAGRGDELHIHLNALPGMVHLPVRLGDILGVRGMESHEPLFFEKAVQSWNGAGITALHEFYPENNQSCVRVAPAHIGNELNLIGGMLIGMMVGSSREVTQGVNGAVVAAFPAVNVLPVGLVPDGSLGDTKSLSVLNKR